MRLRKFLFIICLITLISYSYAQITTGEIKPQKKIIQNNKIYDGYSDFTLRDNNVDYKQYVGLKVFFPGTYTYGFFKDESEYTIKGPLYFIIKDVLYDNDSKKIL